MPAKSRAQARLMRAAAQGDVKLPGLSKEKAKEYVEGVPTKNLPERVKKTRFTKLKKRLMK